MRTPVLRLSPTSIDRYRACPRRFQLEDGLRLDVEQADTYEQVLGQAVHKVLEQLLRLPTHSRDGSLSRLVDSAALRFAAANSYGEGMHEQLRAETAELVGNYVTAGGAGSTARPLKTEQTFQLRLNNGTIIQTRVDRIDRNERGMLEVIDYKTGRNQLDARDLAYETAPIVQLHAVGKASDVPVERVTWVYLRSGEAVSWWPEAEDIDAATDRLIRVLKDIHRDAVFEPNPGPQCSWCPFKDICPGASGDSSQAASFLTELDEAA
jgi:putative RecB family exonuclease